jgi:alpha-1,3-rhamnosyl/mannosyltransferase
VGHYTLGIVSGFDELAGEGKLTYDLITPHNRAGMLAKYGFRNHRKVIKSPIPSKVLRGFMKYRWRVPIDFIFGQGKYYFPSFLSWPTWIAESAVVIHDVTYLAVPECVDKGNREYLSKTVPFSMKNSKNIIAVSEFSKSEIIKYYDIDPSRIHVATPSIDRRNFYKRSAEEIFKVKMKYDIFSDHYILSVGNIEPRKNYDKLVDAYTSLPRSITDKYPLVIVGAGGWNNAHVKERIQTAKENGYRIINPKQFVEDKDMPALYSGAQFFVFTPIYEGFGMPPLESYACGTPVLASKVASVPEAAGKAAVYADPFDVEDIAKKLAYMVEATEKDRHQFDKAIEKHLTELSWRKSAEITASALTGLPIEYFSERKR